MSKAKQNCRWCIHSAQYDEDCYFCTKREFTMSRSRACAYRNCEDYESSWCTCDDLEELSNGEINQRELALYKRRMAGDWS